MVALVLSRILVNKHSENENLEGKCAVSMEGKMLSGIDSKFATGQEKDFAKLWPQLLTHGLGCVEALSSVAAFSF